MYTWRFQLQNDYEKEDLAGVMTLYKSVHTMWHFWVKIIPMYKVKEKIKYALDQWGEDMWHFELKNLNFFKWFQKFERKYN